MSCGISTALIFLNAFTTMVHILLACDGLFPGGRLKVWMLVYSSMIITKSHLFSIATVIKLSNW